MNPLLPESLQQNIILASRSPRRFELLTSFGFEFEVIPPEQDVESGITHDDVFELPEVLAVRKCAHVASRHRESLVIAADTVVILDGNIMNKPRDDDQAIEFLGVLSGRTHTVVTGVAVQKRSAAIEASGRESTQVTFRDLRPDEIARYVATGEGRDKAGSYAAQGLGASLIRSIDGCYFNVVGLPLARLYEMLKSVGG